MSGLREALKGTVANGLLRVGLFFGIRTLVLSDEQAAIVLAASGSAWVCENYSTDEGYMCGLFARAGMLVLADATGTVTMSRALSETIDVAGAKGELTHEEVAVIHNYLDTHYLRTGMTEV